MKPYRSMLFVPAHKASWVDKGLRSGADALILDLEDAVPADEKPLGRSSAADAIDRLAASGEQTALWVRPNSYDNPAQFAADVEAVVRPGLAGLFLPKLFSVEDVRAIDAVVTHIENRDGLVPGGVELLLSYETAQAMADCERIAAASPRVASLLGATGPSADVGRELGFEFTAAGLETLYLRSRLLLAAHAAGLSHPVCGVWQDISDIDGCRQFALDNRGLGYRGMVCIHPSHVAVANDVFTPSTEVVDRHRRMIAAFEAAQAQGHGAVDFEGQHIDLAHAKTAQAVIDLADSLAG